MLRHFSGFKYIALSPKLCVNNKNIVSYLIVRTRVKYKRFAQNIKLPLISQTFTIINIFKTIYFSPAKIFNFIELSFHSSHLFLLFIYYNKILRLQDINAFICKNSYRYSTYKWQDWYSVEIHEDILCL